jgi:hypothetical protein
MSMFELIGFLCLNNKEVQNRSGNGSMDKVITLNKVTIFQNANVR